MLNDVLLATETVKDQEEGESDGEDVHNQSVDGPHFEPVIPLPEKVETKTGEEDEEVSSVICDFPLNFALRM